MAKNFGVIVWAISFINLCALATPAAKSIRTIEWEKFLEIPDGNPDGGNCAVDLISASYGDLDGDGKEEAAIRAKSCVMGTGGADIDKVFRLTSDGSIQEFPMKEVFSFQGVNLSIGLSGGSKTIEGGLIIDTHSLTRSNDSNCCPSGGARSFTYKWNGKEMVLESVQDFDEQGKPIERRPLSVLAKALTQGKVTLKGEIGPKHLPIQMELEGEPATEKLKGRYRYVRKNGTGAQNDGDYLTIDGGFNGIDGVTLDEYDGKKNVTGHFLGTLGETEISGEWVSPNYRRRLPLRLKLVP